MSSITLLATNKTSSYKISAENNLEIRLNFLPIVISISNTKVLVS